MRSQRELLDASHPDPEANTALPKLDVDANELALVYCARGMGVEEANTHAAEVLRDYTPSSPGQVIGGRSTDENAAVGTAVGAALSSFCSFASGALIPVLPYLAGLQGPAALVTAATLVGITLLCTGVIVGLLSGGRAAAPGVAPTSHRLRCCRIHVPAGPVARHGRRLARC